MEKMENNEKELEEREIITTEEDMDKSDPENNENKKYDESRIYYVYEHIRLDKMEPFYIGKGKGERAYDLYRNDHHDAITDEYGHVVVIIADNLTEEEAYWLERDTIEDYVFNLGYGIDIKGHKDYDHSLPHLTNMNWGGIGVISGMHHSEEAKRKIGESEKGEKNPMFGKNAYANKTPEEMEEIGKKKSEALKGRKRSEEIKEKISKKVICITTGKIFDSIAKASDYYGVAISSISFCYRGMLKHGGNLNGVQLQWKCLKDYNNEFKGILINPWDKGKKLFEEHKQKLSKVNSKKVICITTGKIFDSIKEAGNYYNVGNISKCCRGELKSAGKLNGVQLQWKYLKDYNNEFKGILINPIVK